MGDFGKILDEWDSMRDGRRRRKEILSSDRSGSDDGSAFARLVERYPVVDKDSGAEEHTAADRRRPEKLPVQDSIDLHGMTLDEALGATERFIAASVARGLRKVVVIHGKGRDGEGVLKREVRAYLERHRDTGAMGYARGSEGGRGALWVVLRERGAKTDSLG